VSALGRFAGFLAFCLTAAFVAWVFWTWVELYWRLFPTPP
jgi:hypothetical protein